MERIFIIHYSNGSLWSDMHVQHPFVVSKLILEDRGNRSRKYLLFEIDACERSSSRICVTDEGLERRSEGQYSNLSSRRLFLSRAGDTIRVSFSFLKGEASRVWITPTSFLFSLCRCASHGIEHRLDRRIAGYVRSISGDEKDFVERLIVCKLDLENESTLRAWRHTIRVFLSTTRNHWLGMVTHGYRIEYKQSLFVCLDAFTLDVDDSLRRRAREREKRKKVLMRRRSSSADREDERENDERWQEQERGRKTEQKLFLGLS